MTMTATASAALADWRGTGICFSGGGLRDLDDLATPTGFVITPVVGLQHGHPEIRSNEGGGRCVPGAAVFGSVHGEENSGT
jgi:hypothetical protein